MTNENETVDDIVRELRERMIDREHSPSLWPYSDRIEAAHKREIDDLAAVEHGGVIVNGAVRGLKTENERLREALKPIIDVGSDYESWNNLAHTAIGAVRKAQEIINGVRSVANAKEANDAN